jgi:hypothetical protein
VPETAKAVVVWSVSSGTPDYGYIYGEGTATRGGFSVAFDAPPPPEAVNSYGVAVGELVLVPSSFEVPKGKITSSEQIELLGISTRHAVIWKAGSPERINWMQKFPDGFACGQCKAATGEETFDSYEPVSCSEIEIETATDLDTLEGCNWT